MTDASLEPSTGLGSGIGVERSAKSGSLRRRVTAWWPSRRAGVTAVLISAAVFLGLVTLAMSPFRQLTQASVATVGAFVPTGAGDPLADAINAHVSWMRSAHSEIQAPTSGADLPDQF